MGNPMEEPHSDENNVPISRRLARGRMNCCKGPASEPNKIAPEKKTGWQPEPEAQDLIGLTGIELD
jgi:hypothetical protein